MGEGEEGVVLVFEELVFEFIGWRGLEIWGLVGSIWWFLCLCFFVFCVCGFGFDVFLFWVVFSNVFMLLCLLGCLVFLVIVVFGVL